MRFGEVTLIPVNGHGPEDVVVDGEGRIYAGVDDGRILRLSPTAGASTSSPTRAGGRSGWNCTARTSC
jgi:hypothetical protein